MGVTYNALWKILIDKGLNKNFLRENGIHPSTIAKMGKNKLIDTKILVRICEILNCNFSDIIEYVPDNTDLEHS